MTGKTVLVTGGTAGIGKATAVGLATLGARVGITGRDRVRAAAAAVDTRAASGNLTMEVFAADLSSQAQVRRLAGEVLDAYPRLDVVVNNVGAPACHRRRSGAHVRPQPPGPVPTHPPAAGTPDGQRPARVVTVSSGAHATGRIDFTDLQGSTS